MTIRAIVIAATFLVLTFSSGASAQAINGCIKNNGKLKIVADPTDCLPRETPISWNQVGPQGEPGEPGPQGEPGDPEGALQQQLDALQAQTDRLSIVVDSAGEVLGYVLDASGAGPVSWEGATVQFDLPSLSLFSLRVVPQEIKGQRATLWFESEDCTGQAWIEALDARGIMGTVYGIINVVTGIRTFYVADPLDSSEAILRRSWDQGGGCEPAVAEVSAKRAATVDLNSMFTPPFRVTTRERM